MNTFTEKILELKGDCTVTKFAEKAGLTRQAVNSYINEGQYPRLEAIKKICTAYNVTADWLLGLSEVKTTEISKAIACKYTGLSERAIDAIRVMQKSKELERLIIGLRDLEVNLCGLQ